jgi:hypothetical protein
MSLTKKETPIRGHALIQVLASNAKLRQADNPTYTPSFIHIADDVDKVLAGKMRAVLNAQKDLDTYILAKTNSVTG